MLTYIVCDIEANGPIPGPYSMISFGAVAVNKEEGILGEFEINLELRAGIKYKSQSTLELEKLRPLLTGYDSFKLTSLYNLVALSGSLIISLAVLRGNLTAEKGWEIAMLEENWQREQWGQDEESIHHYENKLAEFIIAQNFSKLLR